MVNINGQTQFTKIAGLQAQKLNTVAVKTPALENGDVKAPVLSDGVVKIGGTIGKNPEAKPMLHWGEITFKDGEHPSVDYGFVCDRFLNPGDTAVYTCGGKHYKFEKTVDGKNLRTEITEEEFNKNRAMADSYV